MVYSLQTILFPLKDMATQLRDITDLKVFTFLLKGGEVGGAGGGGREAGYS